jgi:hypothetical protein
MGRRIRKPELRKLLGVTDGGVTSLIARGKFREYRDEPDGLARYDEDEVQAFIERENWTGPRRHPVDVLKRNCELREIRKAKYIALAMRGIIDGKERYELILELACPAHWIDQAFAELSENFESAQARALARAKAEKEEAERKEHDKAQRALEKMMSDDIKRRRKR